jgi:2'-5' RNA ligase
VSVELPDALREAVAAHFASEGRRIAGVRWVAPCNLHLTLKFLGDVAEGRLPELRTALMAAAAGASPFTLALHGAGAFPSPERPRVIWVGAGAGSAELTALALSVEAALTPLGFAPEDRPFSPHLTVGRVSYRPPDPAPLRRLIDSARGREWGEWLVPAVHLMRSELFPKGPIYSILQTTPLPATPRRDWEKEPRDG